MPTCPHCGHEADRGEARCPLCGSPLEPEPGPAGKAEPGAGLPAWEDPAVAFPADLWRTWRRSVLEPGAFFAGVPWGGGLARPVLYYLILSITAAFFTLWWEALGWMPVFPIPPEMGSERGALALVDFFLSPFVALLGLGIGSLVLHLFAILLAPDRRGLGATVRVLSYGAGPAVFAVVPVLGPLVGLAWSLVLHVVGMREAHRTTTGRAAAIVFLPLAVFLALVVLTILALVLVAGVTLLGRGG